MYLTGFPTLTIENPLFVKDSRTSYVRDLGTPDISAVSPACPVELSGKCPASAHICRKTPFKREGCREYKYYPLKNND